MAAKSTENNAVETEAADVDKKVPHQADAPVLELVPDENESFADKAKAILRNKKFLAGVSSVVLIAAGVVVVRKRNENVSEDEVTSD